MMQIDKIQFRKYPLFLAPMEGVTDGAFRTIAKQFGADLVYTEFLSSDALIRNVEGTLNKMAILDHERPTAAQIYGRDVETMVEAAKVVAEIKPDILDINFGCPVKRVAGKGAGSGMMRTPDLMIKITEAIVKAVPHIPVTVKTRLGWDHNSIIIDQLAEPLQDVGIKALTIHGRTRSDMYQGKADWTLIGEIKNNPRIHIPIIGNGDITQAKEAKEAFERYGVDAIMIGRGTIGCPWLFKEMRDYLDEGLTTKLSFDEGLEVLKTLIIQNIEKLEERRGILHSRQHIAQSPIFKGIPNFRSLRIEMLRATTKDELFDLLLKAKAHYEREMGG